MASNQPVRRLRLRRVPGLAESRGNLCARSLERRFQVVVLDHVTTSSRGDRMDELGAVPQRPDAHGERLWVLGLDYQTCLATEQELRDAADADCDDRQAARQRLEQDEPEGLAPGRDEQ